MSVYLSAHPKETLQMLHYMNRIADLHRREPHTYYWRAYDATFRRLKSDYKDASWHVIHQNVGDDARSELLRDNQSPNYMYQNNNRGFRGGRAGGRGRGGFNNMGRGQQAGRGGGKTCNHFNDGHCPYPRCTFQHVCSNCKYNHPLIMCRKAQAGSNAAVSTPPAINAPPKVAPVAKQTK